MLPTGTCSTDHYCLESRHFSTLTKRLRVRMRDNPTHISVQKIGVYIHSRRGNVNNLEIKKMCCSTSVSHEVGLLVVNVFC